MRTIKNLNIPQNSDPKFPFSTIRNETDTEDGTPVIEEIYGDILTNNYKLLEDVGITPTGTQDNDETQYQILEALKKLPNILNDIEQSLILNGFTWNVPFDLEHLPNKYVFVAVASEDYVSGSSYNFKGNSVLQYPFNSSGFKSGDELLIVIDQSTVRAYSLTSLGNNSAKEVFTVMGTPVAFNDTKKIWYQDAGQILSDDPSVATLETTIRVDVVDGSALLLDVFVMNGYALCFCLIPSTNNYFFRQFSLSDFSTSDTVTISGTSFSNADDFLPYVFVESGIVYISNGMNSTANAYTIAKLNYDAIAGTLSFVSTTNIDNTFVKTTNAAIKSGLLYTMISGALNSFDLNSGAKTSLGAYSGVSGQIFGFDGEVYFSSGEVAKKWF